MCNTPSQVHMLKYLVFYVGIVVCCYHMARVKARTELTFDLAKLPLFTTDLHQVE